MKSEGNNPKLQYQTAAELKVDDKSSWAIGGGILGGIGLGLLFQYYNRVAIPSFAILGLGIGLVIASEMSRNMSNGGA